MKTVFHLIFRLSGKALSKGFGVLKKTSSIIYGSALIMSFLIVLIMVLGIGVIIADGKVSFTQNADNLKQLSLGEAGVIDPNAPDYYYQVAQALDIDKINSDMKKIPQMKNFFNDLRIYPTDTSKSVEYPGKDIDIYMLCCEIEARPEINSDNFDSQVLMEFILGNWRCESGCAMGTGERLWDSELPYYCNSSGYCDPLGQHHALYTGSYLLTSTNSVGCSFISKWENKDIPDEQRGVFNSNYAAISASDISSRTFYPSNTALFRNDANVLKASSSDKAIQYLINHKIKGAEVAHRGSFTWLPDAFYTAFYANRVMNEGRDRDTHNSTTNITGNNKAIKEICYDAGLTEEQVSLVLGAFASSNRFFKWNTQNVKEGPAGSSGTDGLLIYTYMCLFGENVLQDYASQHHSAEFTSNTAIRNAMFGDPNYGATAIYTDSLYASIRTKINANNGLSKSYNQNTIDGFLSFASFWENSEGADPYGQKSHNLQYPGLSYIYGAMLKQDMETMIEAYYNYTDASGNHPYRLYEVSLSVDGISVSGGQGPFGLSYQKEDGTPDYKNLAMANYIFSQLADISNIDSPTITVKGTYTLNLDDGPYTVILHGGKDVEYPNFWGIKYNETAQENWGQCTWWAKGRAMLCIYETVSQEEKYWNVNGELTGNGYDQVYNFVERRGVTEYAKGMLAFKSNAVTTCPRGYANHVFFTEYVDEKTGTVFQSHGNFSMGCHTRIIDQGGNIPECKEYWAGPQFKSLSVPSRWEASGHGYVGILAVRPKEDYSCSCSDTYHSAICAYITEQLPPRKDMQ